MAKICPHCNSSIPEKAIFCPICYESVSNKNNQNVAQETNNYRPRESRPSFTQAYNNYYFYKTIIGTFVFLFLGIISLVIGIIILFAFDRYLGFAILGLGGFFLFWSAILFCIHKALESY